MIYSIQPYTDIPEECLNNSRIYSNRRAMLAALPIPRGGKVAEIGVGLGDFTQIIMDIVRPVQFFALDLFDLHMTESLWGTPTNVVFKGMTHEKFYKDRFKDAPVTVMMGFSHAQIGRLPDASLDLIYIDADHTYDEVKKDALLSIPKLRHGGIIIFNDYTLFDQYAGVPYGVIRAAHEIIEEHDFEVLGLALEKNMFCDLAIRKRGTT